VIGLGQSCMAACSLCQGQHSEPCNNLLFCWGSGWLHTSLTVVLSCQACSGTYVELIAAELACKPHHCALSCCASLCLFLPCAVLCCAVHCRLAMQVAQGCWMCLHVCGTPSWPHWLTHSSLSGCQHSLGQMRCVTDGSCTGK
jgi:hypothetical protein